ncbi:hypothetical protein ABPG75_001307 [Micractinium tetrahymenae]
MRAWRMVQPARALDRAQALPAAPQSGRRARVAARSCSSAMQPAPADTRATQQQQPWCRPLSGCAAPAPDAAVTAAAPQAQQQRLPPVVALGKFDALHRGHRALAAAAAALGGSPWMVSFSGMAEVLGWPARLPLVAPCDRQRVLDSWAAHCQGRQPQECAIPFAEVRTMSPEAFVELLAAELQAAGVVVGSNYRFGYRAAGTAELLQQLGPQHGMQVQVLGLVASQQAGAAAAEVAAAKAAEGGAAQQHAEQQRQHEQQAAGSGLQAAAPQPQHGQQQQHEQQRVGQQRVPSPEERTADREEAQAAVSSSRVRHALAAGDMADAAACLGRPYRLVASLAEAASSALPGAPALRLPAAALLNQPPGPGAYEVEALLVGADTRDVLVPAWRATARLDEAGLTLLGGGELLAGQGLPPGAVHLALDFFASLWPVEDAHEPHFCTQLI